MTSAANGNSISEAEILSISEFGIWMFVSGKEYFLDYTLFPWFKDARVKDIIEFSYDGKGNLHWPILDVDLSTSIIDSPKSYPKVSK